MTVAYDLTKAKYYREYHKGELDDADWEERHRDNFKFEDEKKLDTEEKFAFMNEVENRYADDFSRYTSINQYLYIRDIVEQAMEDGTVGDSADLCKCLAKIIERETRDDELFAGFKITETEDGRHIFGMYAGVPISATDLTLSYGEFIDSCFHHFLFYLATFVERNYMHIEHYGEARVIELSLRVASHPFFEIFQKLYERKYDRKLIYEKETGRYYWRYKKEPEVNFKELKYIYHSLCIMELECRDVIENHNAIYG